MAEGGGLERAYVNDGGDIAFHLTPGTRFTAAIAGAAERVRGARRASRCAGLPLRGWRGRSLSLGIADAVTVLAPTPPRPTRRRR